MSKEETKRGDYKIKEKHITNLNKLYEKVVKEDDSKKDKKEKL